MAVGIGVAAAVHEAVVLFGVGIGLAAAAYTPARGELEQVSLAGVISDASDAELLDELARRLEDRGAENDTDATVHHVDFGAGIDDERAVASERHDDPNDSDEHFID